MIKTHKENSFINECTICILPLVDKDTYNDHNSKPLKSLSINYKAPTSDDCISENSESTKNDSILTIDDMSFESNRNSLSDNVIVSESVCFLSKLATIFSSLSKLWFKIFFTFHNFKSLRKEEFIETECKHIFHSECLRDWMKIKHQCPVDRKEIIADD